MAGRRFFTIPTFISAIRRRATLVALVAVAIGLLAWGQAGGSSPAAADDTAVPAAGLDFSIGIDTDGDTTDDCSSSGMPTDECVLDGGERFGVNFYLNSLPNKAPQYALIAIILAYDGVSWTGLERWAWPDAVCVRFAIPPGDDGMAELPCGTLGTLSSYTGLMVTTDFACAESGSIGIVHGWPDTALLDSGTAYAEGDGTTETLAVICGEPPTATPTPTSEPTHTPTPTWPPIPLYGDVNCDGWVDSVDSLLILQYHAALVDSLPCLEGADMNGDGRVDCIDALWILQFPNWIVPLPPLSDNTPVYYGAAGAG